MSEKVVLREGKEKGVFYSADVLIDLRKKKTIRFTDHFIRGLVRQTVKEVIESLKR